MTDIATLGLSIDSSQVNTAINRLRDLAAQGAATGSAIGSVSQSSTTLEATVTRATRATEEMARSQARQEAAMRQMSAGFAGLTSALNGSTAALNAHATAARTSELAMSSASDSAKRLMSKLAAGFGVSQLISTTDQYTKFTAQLKLATNGAIDYDNAMTSVRQSAKLAQQDIGAMGTLYARMARGTEELNISQKQLSDITSVVGLSLKVSGATQAESASAMLQLSQAFASGTLRGEEFNAVNEAAPRLMQALANGMGVPIGALKNMASEGMITSKIMADALPGSLKALIEESKKVETIGGAFTLLKNNTLELIGANAQTSGSVKILTSGIGFLAENLNVLAAGMATLAAVKMGTWLESLAVQTYQAVAAQRALSASSTAAGVAMGMLGGPIGAIITVLGLGAMAWLAWGNASKDASDKATEATQKSTQSMIDSINEQIKKIDQRNEALNYKPNIEATSPEQERLGELQLQIKKLDDVKNKSALSEESRLTARMKLLSEQGLLEQALNTRAQKTEEENRRKSLRNAEPIVKKLWMKEAGIKPEYLKELADYKTALEAGALTQAEYVRGVTKLANAHNKASEEGKAAAKSARENASAAKQEQSGYATLVASIKAKTEENLKAVATEEKLGSSVKMREQLNAALAQGSKKMTAAHRIEAEALLTSLAASEKRCQFTKNKKSSRMNATKAHKQPWRILQPSTHAPKL